MYVKFFSNKKGGSSASIKYLLNNREQEGTARTLKGDPKLTSQIINSIERKQKATVGVLSFEELNPLTEEQKHEIIENFEKTLLPGMDKEQYNILWVEHTDKGRLELNFVIPKIELTTGKALQPYYHKQDFSRVEMFEDIYNIKYNLSSKKDPAKVRTLQGSHKEIKLIRDYKELDKTLLELVAAQQLRSREQLIETVKSAGIEVTREGKDYISLKLPDSKRAKKFKGGIYEQQFTSLESLEAISTRAEQRAREFRQRDTQAEFRTTIERLNKYNEQKAQINRERYQEREQDDNREHRLRTGAIEKEQDQKLHHNSTIELDNRLDSGSNAHESTLSVDSSGTDEIQTRGNEVHSEQKPTDGGRNNIYTAGGEIDDSTRTTLERRDRERETILKEVRSPIIYQSRSLQKELRGAENRIYKQLYEDKSSVQTKSERHTKTADRYIEQDSKPIYEEARRVMQERRKRRGVRERLREAIDDVRERYIEFKDELIKNFENITGRLKEIIRSQEKIKERNDNKIDPDEWDKFVKEAHKKAEEVQNQNYGIFY